VNSDRKKESVPVDKKPESLPRKKVEDPSGRGIRKSRLQEREGSKESRGKEGIRAHSTASISIGKSPRAQMEVLGPVN